MVHGVDAFHQDPPPIFETGGPSCPDPDITPPQQGGQDPLEHSDGPFRQVGLALLGFEPDNFTEARHLGFELSHVLVTEGRLSVRVEHLHPFKPIGLLQHFQDDGAKTVPGLVLDGPDKHGRGQTVHP